MKITITYLPGEEHMADDDLKILYRKHPESRTRRSKAHLPAVSAYMRISPGDFRKLTPCDFCNNRGNRRACESCQAMV